jgi:hypothetical protein
MGALKVWDGTTWQTVSQQGPAGTAPVTSVDGRTGAVTLTDLYRLPLGGSAGQVLGKRTATDLDVGWLTQLYVQGGTVSGTPGPDLGLTFPTAFANLVSVVGVAIAVNFPVIISIVGQTATGCSFRCFDANGAYFSGIAVSIAWVAIGGRP